MKQDKNHVKYNQAQTLKLKTQEFIKPHKPTKTYINSYDLNSKHKNS